MCTYQGADFVGEQLESILSQTRPPDEVVVFDDASTDETVEVVRDRAASTDVPVRFQVNDRTRGYRRNFEQAVRACTGEVIFLADQDDLWFPEKIERMLPALEEPEALIVHCDAVLADRQLRSRRQTVFGRHPVLGREHGDRRLALRRRMSIPGCTLAFHSELTEALVPYSDLWGHDLWTTLVGGALGRVVPVSTPLMLYRRHTSGAGPSRHIDAGPVGRAGAGVRARGDADYELDLRKWQQLVDRLEEIGRRPGSDDRRRERLGDWLEEYRQRLDLARFREQVRRRPRAARIAPVLRKVAAGDYRRYLRAVSSPVKDALL